MIKYLLLGLFVSLDNLRISLSLGTADLDDRQRRVLPVLFGLFEAGMPLLGYVLAGMISPRVAEFGEFMEWFGLVAVGILLIGGAIRSHRAGEWINSRWTLLFIPLLFSFDNLFAGASLAFGTSSNLLIGVLLTGGISGITAFFGLSLGKWVRTSIPEPRVVGIVMLVFLSIPVLLLG